MALLYSVVARERTVLAEYSAVAAGNTSAIMIARRVLEKVPLLPSSSDDDGGAYCKRCYCFTMDRYIFHVLRCADALVFLCITSSSFPRTIAFAYLKDIRRRLINDYYKTIVHGDPSYPVIADFSSILRQQMELISSNPNTDTMNRDSKDCETHTIIVESIEMLLDKGERIELIDDKIATIHDAAFNLSDFESLEIDMEKKCALLAKKDTRVNDRPGTSTVTGDNMPFDCPSDDDWESIADLPPEKLLSPVAPLAPPIVADQIPQNHEFKAPKRRGRGTFSYKKEELYSDRVSGGSFPAEQQEAKGLESDNNKRNTDQHSSRFITSHVLVLSGFSPTIKTTDLEKIFEDFSARGFVIRWVDDTTALAVFQTPSTAVEAMKSKKFPFSVRLLDEDDSLVALIPTRDLEPPRPRPKTSAVTARRLIAHGMGIKLPSNTDSAEFRKQEEARKKRIIARQSLKEDAWGDDD